MGKRFYRTLPTIQRKEMKENIFIFYVLPMVCAMSIQMIRIKRTEETIEIIDFLLTVCPIINIFILFGEIAFTFIRNKY